MRIAMIGQKGIVTGETAGGVERHVREVSSRLTDRGHKVAVYARKKYDPDGQQKINGVDLVYLPTIYRKHTEAIIHTFLSTVHALFKKYDVIHYHGVGPATLSWIPRLLKRRTTIVVTFHSQDQFHQKWRWFARKYLALGERAAVKVPHYCITVSHALQVYCRDTYDREAVFIPNGAEVKDVKGSGELAQFGLEPGEYILNVGRMVPQKGLQFLIEAFKEIETEKQLVFVGAGGFSDDYEKQVRELAKDDDRIRFVGFQEGKTRDQLYAHAYLYCHPSESEGLPLAVLEAMSFATAPLVSDIPANLEAIHRAGEVFESGNVEDLRKKLEELLARPERVEELGQDARAVVEVHFNWEKIAERTESVYITARH